jgi:threonine dehydrogenase-like Zn-dependent dehydrogenase
MRALTISGTRDLELVDIDPPTVSPGEVLVDVAYCGICGSDLHMLRMSEAHGPAGHVLGHEFTGVIAELGRDVDGWERGQRVVVFPMIACAECRACRDGHPKPV